jgi:hypothetical protein
VLLEKIGPSVIREDVPGAFVRRAVEQFCNGLPTA